MSYLFTTIGKKARETLVKFAMKQNLDPLQPSTWYQLGDISKKLDFPKVCFFSNIFYSLYPGCAKYLLQIQSQFKTSCGLSFPRNWIRRNEVPESTEYVKFLQVNQKILLKETKTLGILI